MSAFSAGPEPPGRRALVGRLAAGGAVAGLLMAAVAAPAVMTAGAASNAVVGYWDGLPTTLPSEPPPQRSTILAADGSKIAEFFQENRVPLRLAEVAPIARRAVVAVEDDRFYSHGPIDLRGTLRALVNNSAGGGRQGGSTLTQQYVKNQLLNTADTSDEKARATEVSLARKAAEARLAAALEKTMTKDQILEGYLNIAYYGDGAYGIGTAAQHYFSVPASKLSLEQAALLAGLVQNPIGYDPTRHPEAARTRRNIVLARMRDTGVITAAQAAVAQRTPVTLKLSDPANGCTASRYPLYCQWIKDTLLSDPTFGVNAAARKRFVDRGGLVIKTAMQPKVMAATQKAVDDALGRDNQFAAGVAVVQPGTGHVLGFAQNRTFGVKPGQTNVNYPTMRSFQPGSTFKPITYATGLENGFPVEGTINAPARFYPTSMNAPPAGYYRNQSSVDAGVLTAGQAIARSSNTWFLTLEQDVGVPKVAAMADRLGYGLKSKVGPRDGSLTLGAYDTSPLRMAAIYASFAAHGRVCAPIGIVSITDATGAAVKVPSAGCHQEVRAGIADAVTAGLAQTIDGPDPYRTGKNLSLGRPAAGKTGTTDGNSAVWFAGFTPQLATAVWVGDPRGGQAHPVNSLRLYGNRISSVFGSTAAGPIWRAAMLAMHEGAPVQHFAPVGPAELSGATSITPDVRGLTVDQAIGDLQRSGFTVTIAPQTAAESATSKPGQVASQTPAPGTVVGLRGTARLVLTAGSDTSKVVPAP